MGERQIRLEVRPQKPQDEGSGRNHEHERTAMIDRIQRFLRRKENPQGLSIEDRFKVVQFIDRVRATWAEHADSRFADRKIWTDDDIANEWLDMVQQSRGEVVELPQGQVKAGEGGEEEYTLRHEVGYRERFDLGGKDIEWRIIKVQQFEGQWQYVFYPHQEASTTASTDSLVERAYREGWVVDAQAFDNGQLLSVQKRRAAAAG